MVSGISTYLQMFQDLLGHVWFIARMVDKWVLPLFWGDLISHQKRFLCVPENKSSETLSDYNHTQVGTKLDEQVRKSWRDTKCDNNCQSWLSFHSWIYDHKPYKKMAAINLNTATRLKCQRITFLATEVKVQKKCPLTKNCACWLFSQCIGCCTVEVGTCSLHFWNIQVLFITENIWWITRTPRNCRFWISFHLADKWRSLFAVNKEFICKCNLGRNCKELRNKTNQQTNLKLSCDC